MAIGKTNAGGAGGGLNFDVKDFRTEAELLASTGKENRIGVVTPVPMTGWRFDANQPEDLQEGEVWFCAGAISALEFNALKKNWIQIYPLSAKQLTGKTLEKVPAKTFRNGIWEDWWDGRLYEYGDEFEDITGGWTTEGFTYSGYTMQPGNFTKGSDYLLLNAPGTSAYACVVGCKNAIDLSGYSFLEITYTNTSFTNNIGLVLSIATSKEVRADRVAQFIGTGAVDTKKTERTPISLSGKYYIGCSSSKGCGGKLHSLKLIR